MLSAPLLTVEGATSQEQDSISANNSPPRETTVPERRAVDPALAPEPEDEPTEEPESG